MYIINRGNRCLDYLIGDSFNKIKKKFKKAEI